MIHAESVYGFIADIIWQKEVRENFLDFFAKKSSNRHSEHYWQQYVRP